MIAGLRRGHRAIVGSVATVLTAVFLAAAMGAADEPRTVALPVVLADREIAAPDVVWERDDLWGDRPIVTRWRSDRRATGSHEAVIELELAAPLRRPEVLLYWSPTLPADPAADLEALPDTSHLLGAVGGVGARRFALPAAARSGGGHLLLYSLGHEGVFATAALPDGADR